MVTKKTVKIYIQIHKGVKARDTVQHTAESAEEAVAFIKKNA